MTYVEWLRVRGCLKWVAIVLVVGVALILFGRFTYLDFNPHQASRGMTVNGIDLVDLERISQKTETKLPDGTLHSVFVDPKHGIRMTIDDRGYWGKHVDIFEASPLPGAHAGKTDFGDVHFTRTMLPNGSRVVADLGAAAPEDLSYYFALAAIGALFVATILGAPFARENDGHLEIAATKPISREPLALAIIAVDLAGIAAGWIMTVLVIFIGHVIFEAPNYTYGPTDTFIIACGFLGSVAWYAMLTAATASMKRAYGTILGVAWPVALIVVWLATSNLGASPLGQLIAAVSKTIAWIDPLSYLHFGAAFSGQSVIPESNLRLTLLAILALVYGAIAILQWRRVEA